MMNNIPADYNFSFRISELVDIFGINAASLRKSLKNVNKSIGEVKIVTLNSETKEEEENLIFKYVFMARKQMDVGLEKRVWEPLMKLLAKYKIEITKTELEGYKKYSSFALSNLFRMAKTETDGIEEIEIPYDSVRDAVLGAGSEEYLGERGEELFYHKVVVPTIKEMNSVGVLKISERGAQRGHKRRSDGTPYRV